MTKKDALLLMAGGCIGITIFYSTQIVIDFLAGNQIPEWKGWMICGALVGFRLISVVVADMKARERHYPRVHFEDEP